MKDFNKCERCANSNTKPRWMLDLILIGITALLLFPISFYLAQRSSRDELIGYVYTVWTMYIGIAIGRALVDYYIEYKKNATK